MYAGSMPPPLWAEVLAIDPGRTVGWAARFMPKDRGREGVLFGQCESRGMIVPRMAKVVVIERPPIGVKRAMDRDVYYSAGHLVHSLWPQAPVWQDPPAMNVSKTWVTFKRGSGISQHAKDAVLHLVFYLAGVL